MTELKRQEYDENGYVSYPGLVDPSQLEILLAEIDRISNGNTLAAHDKKRLEMEPNQKPDGRLVRRITSHAPTMRPSVSCRTLPSSWTQWKPCWDQTLCSTTVKST
jgi:hypothetical protein